MADYSEAHPTILKAKISSWVPVEILLTELVEGDLVEIDRGLFHHWALYIGPMDGYRHYIVHLSSFSEQLEIKENIRRFSFSNPSTGLRRSLSNQADAAEVKAEDIVQVVGTSKCRVNNSDDNSFEPFVGPEIVARAVSELGKRKYHLLLTNCEHFVHWCRYGHKRSMQVSKAKFAAVGLGAFALSGSVCVGVTAAVALYSTSLIAGKVMNRLSRDGNWTW